MFLVQAKLCKAAGCTIAEVDTAYDAPVPAAAFIELLARQEGVEGECRATPFAFRSSLCVSSRCGLFPSSCLPLLLELPFRAAWLPHAASRCRLRVYLPPAAK